MNNSDFKLINIGCGLNPKKKFTNYDHNIFIFFAKIPFLRTLFKKIYFIPFGYIRFMELIKEFNILYCDATKKIPEKSSTVDLVYSSHMIEHLDSKEMQSFFEECKRVLKPNGYLRIVVPDFDYLIDIYNKDFDVDSFIKRSDLVGKKPKSLIKKYSTSFKVTDGIIKCLIKDHLKKNLQIQVFQILGF